MSSRRTGVAQSGAAALGVILLGTVYIAAMAWLLQKSYDVAGGVLVGHVLALVTVPPLLRLLRDEDPKVRRVILVGLVVKLAGTFAIFAVVFGVYGSGDARQYSFDGALLAQGFRHGDLSIGALQGKLIGTNFISVVTGIVYTVIGPTVVGGFLFFSWLSFWGLYLFYRAFRLALPQGDHVMYAKLLFFLPSIVLWSSSISKEAWMVLTMGMVAYGAARLLTHQGHGVGWLLVGLAATAMVRPHITIVMAAAMLVAYLITSARRSSYSAAASKVLGVVAMMALVGFALVAAQSFLKLDSATDFNAALEGTQQQTERGDSQFTTVSRSPVQIPYAVFSTIFRPLPFEASNAQTLATSLEGAVLLGLFVLRLRRLRNFLPSRGSPYLTFAALYSAMFALAFSSIANFGILARQRVQLFPLLLVALSVPVHRRSNRGQEAAVDEPPAGRRSARSRAALVPADQTATVGT